MAKKILIVDDDPDLVEAVSTILESKGYAVLRPMAVEDWKRPRPRTPISSSSM